MKRAILAAAVLLAGCSSAPKYVEGTTLSLGAYIPWDGNLYGVELMSYVSGVVIKAPTNTLYEVSRTYSATNEWGWGLLKSVESSNTKVKFSK